MSGGDEFGIEDYFHRLADLPADEQQRKLDEWPLNDAQRNELVALLRADASQGDAFLKVPGDGPTNQDTIDQLTTDPATGTGGQAPLAAGDMLGEYRLQRLLGEGAFGSVWEAYDIKLSRAVAIKIPKRVDAVERDRMLREAQAVAQLRHPNLLTVHRVVDEPRRGRMFIVTDLATGGSLSDQTRRDWSPKDVVEFVAKLARGLACAHAAGIVHRDLKPDNVLLSGDGEPLIADFGLAKRMTTDVTRTIEGMVMGTPAYMSPEQAQGHGYKADPRSDVFSMGVILYEMLTGERPFRGTVRMVMEQIIKDEPTDPRRLNGAIPRDVATICLKCLHKQPTHRYADAAALAEDLERWIAGKPVAARPVGPVGRLSRWCRRHPAVALASTLFVLSLLAGITVSLMLAWRAERRARQIARQDAAQRLAGHALEFRDWKPRLGLTLALEAVELSRGRGEPVASQVAWTLTQLCSEMHPTELLVADADQISLMDDGVLFTLEGGLFWKTYAGRQARLASDPVERMVANVTNSAVCLRENTGQRWKLQATDGQWQAGTIFAIADRFDCNNPHHEFAFSPDGLKLVVHAHDRGELLEFQFTTNGELASRRATELRDLESLAVFDSGFAYGTPLGAWWRGFADRNEQLLPGVDPRLDLAPQFALSPSGECLAMAQFDTVRTFDVKDGLIGKMKVLHGAPHIKASRLYKNRVAFISENSLVVTGVDGLAAQVSTESDDRTTHNFDSPVRSVASSGSDIAFGTSAGVAWIDETVGTARPNRCLDGAVESLRLVNLDDQEQLAIAGGRTVRLWAYKRWNLSTPLRSPTGAVASQVSRDGNWFVVKSEASLLQRANGVFTRLCEPADRLRVSSFSPDSQFLATLLRSTRAEPDRVEIRSLSDRGAELVFAANTPTLATILQWSTTGVLSGLDPTGELIQWTRRPDGWSMVSGSIGAFDEMDIQFSADHRRMAFASTEGFALVECGDAIESNWLQRGAAQRGAIAPDGQSAACVMDGQLVIWDVRGRDEIAKQILAPRSELSTYAMLQFSPNGEMLAFGNGNNLLLGQQGPSWTWRKYLLLDQFIQLVFLPDSGALFATSFAGPSPSENMRSEMLRVDLAAGLGQSAPIHRPYGGVYLAVNASSSRMLTWGVRPLLLDPPIAIWDLTSPSQLRGVPLIQPRTYAKPEFLDSGEVFVAGGYVLDPSLDGWVRRARAIVDRPLTAAQRRQFGIPD